MDAKEIKLPVRKWEPWVEVNGYVTSFSKYESKEIAQEVLDTVIPAYEKVGMKITDSGIAKAI